jgi:lipopolysaccharide/colanic/teichoic acid biosynthesis glycosyltransferase
MGADVIFLAGGAFDSGDRVRRLVWELEDRDIQVVIAPSVTDVSSDRVSVRPVGGLPLIHLENPRSEAASRRAKRSFDVLAGVALIVLFAPLLLVAALQVWRHDRGPVWVQQTHVGRDGHRFRVWKLRTMVADVQQDGADDEAGLFEAPDHPYLTPPGRWMRRHSIDELPQLLNVVTGDMSLVGPRVPLRHESTQLEEVNRRLRVRPGVTGVWRDFRRSDLSWSEAVTLDIHYANHWSLLQDLSILARTFGAALRGTAVVTR